MFMLGVREVGQVGLIERLKVVKEGLHDIFIKVVVWEELGHCHENGIAIFGGQ